MVAIPSNIEAAHAPPSDDWLHMLSAAIHDAVCVLDRLGRPILLNPAAEQLLGWSAASLARAIAAGRSFQDLVLSEVDGAALRRDGTLVPVEISRQTSTGGATVIVLRDRTPEQQIAQLRQRAETSERMKTKFLTAASHDLRQPMQTLCFLSGHLQSLILPVASETLARLETNLAIMKTILDKLLDVSRLDATTLRPNLEDVPLAAVLDRLRDDYAPAATEKGLRFLIGSSSAVVRSDRDLLGKLLANLLDNAIKFTAHGRVMLDCYVEDARLLITIEDTGIGIDPVHFDAIFEEFYQIDNAARDRVRGLGLGLATARRIAALLDHPIEVRSELGQGAVFTVTVPLVSTLRPPIMAVPIVSASRGIVLLVDDDAALRDSFDMTLEDLGYERVVAASGDAALALLARDPSRPPDVMVLDYRLVGESGVDVAQRIRQHFGGRPIPGLLLTGDYSEDLLALARDNDLALLHKPITIARLDAALTQLQQDSRVAAISG